VWGWGQADFAASSLGKNQDFMVSTLAMINWSTVNGAIPFALIFAI
jgi:hypothetical protein